MGIFDSLFGGMEDRKKLNAQEAFAGVLLGASACDGHIADEEVQSLFSTLMRMKLYQRFSEKEFGRMFDKLQGVLKKHGVEKLIDGCSSALPSELNNTAFANAVNIVLADGIVDDDEKEFIERLRKILHIESGTAKAIAQVMVIKNKG